MQLIAVLGSFTAGEIARVRGHGAGRTQQQRDDQRARQEAAAQRVHQRSEHEG